MPTRYTGTEDEQRALDLFIKLTRAAASVVHSTQAGFRDCRITASQFGVLDALYFVGPLPIGEIARKHLCSQNSMTSVVDTMERSELVRRVRNDEDRRVVSVELTDKGRELFEEIWPHQRANIVKAMSALSTDEQDELSRLLRKLGRGQGAAGCCGES